MLFPGGGPTSHIPYLAGLCKEKPAKRILGPFQQKKDESDPGCIDDNDERL